MVTSIFSFPHNVFKRLLPHRSLTLYHTIPTINDPNEKGFGKHWGKRRKCWKPAFSPFPTVFSNLTRREIIILTASNLSSANAFNLDQAKILSFGKELTHYHTMPHFDTRKTYNCRKCCEKRRLLVTSNLSFSHNVWYPYISF